MEMQISTMSSVIEKSERLRMTDVITGIPNQEQFFIDLRKVASAVSYDSPFHLVFIGLVAFGDINKIWLRYRRQDHRVFRSVGVRDYA